MHQRMIYLFYGFLWKNFRLRRHHLFLSFVEFTLPIAIIGLIVLAKSPDGSGDDTFRESNVTIFKKVSSSEVIASSFDSPKVIILYSPDTKFTNDIMGKVKGRLEVHFPSTDMVFLAVDNEKEMEIWFKQFYRNISDANRVYGAGIIFQQSGKTRPTHLVYKIRVVSDSECSTDRIFPAVQIPGPVESGDFYFTNGFLALQLCVDDAYISLDNNKTEERFLQAFPHPPYEDFKFLNLFINAMPQLICFGFIFMITSLIKCVINEKNSGSVEFMKLVGAPHWIVNCISWLLYTFFIHFWVVLILTILLKYPFGGSALLEYSDGFLIWTFFILFIIHTCIFTLAIAALFNNALIGETVGTLIWIFSYVALDVILQSRVVSVYIKFIIAMLPTGYIILGFEFIGSYERIRGGASFGNLFYAVKGSDNDITLGAIFIAMFLGTMVFLFVLNYFIVVKPGMYGTAKPWFFCIPNICSLIRHKSNHKVNIPLLTVKKGIVEDVPSNHTIGLSIRNLHKNFGNTTAIKNLSLDIYKGEITALLGHNGAGKTTLMSIITGLLSHDDGEIYIDGHSIFPNLHKIRQNWGLCTQHNLLFPYFTTSDHIMFYAMLKGLSRKEASMECKKLLTIFCMESKGKVHVSKLSGGMKRKLSMSIALIGDPKLLILDEPTSGMDPQSRRELWDVLLAMRGRRTVIITTHFMEEADVLGDRIAIMDHGELKCFGSSLFLKKHYGAGYIMTVIFSENKHMDDVTTLVMSLIPQAIIKYIRNAEISFGLPGSKCSTFSELFSMLESSPNMGIEALGLSCTTMEDVFLRVSDHTLEEKSINGRGVEDDQNIITVDKFVDKIGDFNSSHEALMPMKLVGVLHHYQSAKLLMIKKIIWSFRHWFSTLFFVLICPAVIALLALRIIAGNVQFMSCSYLIMDLNIYGKTEILLSGNNSQYAESFKSIIYSKGSIIKEILQSGTIIQGLLAASKENEQKYQNGMIVAADFTSEPNLLYSTNGIHAPSIAVNVFSNVLLKMSNSTVKNLITTYNHPLIINTMEICQLVGHPASIISTTVAMTLLLGLIYCFGNVLSFAISERITMFKHLQLMCGLSPVIYWAVVLTWDFILHGITTTLVVIIITCILDPIHLTSYEVMGPLILVFFLGSMSTLWMAYFFSLFTNTFAKSYSLYTTINVLGLLINILMHNFSYAIKKEIFYVSNAALMLIPHYALASCFSKIIMFGFLKFQCKMCGDSRQLQQFCKVNQVKEKSCFSWESYEKNYETGINMEIILLIIDCALYCILTLLYEYKVFHLICNYFIKYYHGDVVYDYDLDDSDVVDERHTIKNLNKERGGPILIVDGITKKFSKSLTAVHGVSFAVNQGECFGLLGVNGAGKTTTFRMLTGDLLPTDGTASVLNYTLQKQRQKYLSSIGYCPQESGLNESLTGYETLMLFACLRGIHPSNIKSTVNSWIQLLGLQEYCHKTCGTYSGGNKRKLSTGVSLIGRPIFVFLDEPTSRVDPVSRRKLWDILAQCRKNGQTFVICSHSMYECEAVCTRITIMAQGQMRCIGSVQYLKHIYGQGYIILIKVRPQEESELQEVKEYVKDYISASCILKDEHFGLLNYHLTDASYKLSSLFDRMEELKKKCGIVEDYIITQSTMEQVFLSFAKQ